MTALNQKAEEYARSVAKAEGDDLLSEELHYTTAAIYMAAEMGYVAGYTARDGEDGWISCAQQMPDYDQLVFWIGEEGLAFVEMLDKDGNPFLEELKPTHWMRIPELPQPPKQK